MSGPTATNSLKMIRIATCVAISALLANVAVLLSTLQAFSNTSSGVTFAITISAGIAVTALLTVLSITESMPSTKP